MRWSFEVAWDVVLLWNVSCSSSAAGWPPLSTGVSPEHANLPVSPTYNCNPVDRRHTREYSAIQCTISILLHAHGLLLSHTFNDTRPDKKCSSPPTKYSRNSLLDVVCRESCASILYGTQHTGTSTHWLLPDFSPFHCSNSASAPWYAFASAFSPACLLLPLSLSPSSYIFPLPLCQGTISLSFAHSVLGKLGPGQSGPRNKQSQR